MTTNHTEKNYAPLWKKLTVVGAIVATVSGLAIAQNLASVSASEKSEYIAVTDFAAGSTQATILSEDGNAYSRGWNNEGQLGVAVGSKVKVAEWTKVEVPEKLVNVESNEHTVALGESGKLYTWGPNSTGQIGNGETTTAFIPNQITAVDRYSKIASGAAFTVALDEQGRLWSWGANNAGQLGDESTTNTSIPKMISDEAAFSEVYAAKETAYAIASDGTLWAWGANNEGQIGDGTKDSRNKPSPVQTMQKWSQLAVSLMNNTVLGVDTSGELYSWGSNNNALLGNGTDWRKLQKEEDERFRAMIEQIEREDAARKDELINKCVDEKFRIAHADYENEYEKVAEEREKALEEAKKEEKKKKEEEESTNPTASPSPTPSPTGSPSPSPTETKKPIPNPDDLDEPERGDFIDKCTKDVEKTFAKTDTSDMKPAVIKEPELKEGHNSPEEVVTEIVVKDIAIGSENAHLVDGLGRLFSWGKDANGQTGLNLEDEKSHTQVPVLAKEGVSEVDAGDKYGVALGDNGDLLMWGLNTNGVLFSKAEDLKSILKPTVKGSGYSKVVAGLTSVYAFKDKTAYAWGNNASGELGTGNGDSIVPTAFALDKKITSIAPSAKGAVALGEGSELLYWGVNDSGQFGNNATSNEPEKVVSSNEMNTFSAISAGAGFTTAVSSDGRMWGWGTNAQNLLDLSGNGNNRVTPTAISSNFSKVTAIAAGKNVSAMTNGSVLTIWAGNNSHSYELEGIVELAAGDDHVLARTQDGGVWNWSLNESGVRAGTAPETLVQFDTRIYATIAAGGTLSGATTEQGETVIWGAGSEKLRLASDEGSAVENFSFVRMSISNGYILATDDNHVLWGWGESSYGVLGSKSASDFPTVLTKMEDNNEKEGK